MMVLIKKRGLTASLKEIKIGEKKLSIITLTLIINNAKFR
jgi:hypothetical protein